MTALNLTTSEMLPPFVVFDGTKITTAKQPERTLAYKHRNWRNSKPGGTGRMTFQKKHQFDADITIMWFEGGIISRQGAATQRRAATDLFLKPIFPIFGLLGLKLFRMFESILRRASS